MNSSIHEVVRTLVEAVLIVTLVVFAFLGSPRSVLIPVVAIPLSLIGTFTMMLVLRLLHQPADAAGAGAGHRPGGGRRDHRGGKRQPPSGRRHAADPGGDPGGARTGGPIIAMTVVLIAVYVPIGFQGGLTGALFTEFAFTLVGAVTVSGDRRADAVADDVLAPAASA